MLDWDDEAPPEGAEIFSSEQGLRKAQQEELKRRVDAGGEGGGGGGEGAGEGINSLERISADLRFDLILASDVVYSYTHATQLPQIIARRLKRGSQHDGSHHSFHAPPPAGDVHQASHQRSDAVGGLFAAMVPVRSEDHTRVFLSGLHERGMRVHVSCVDAEWVEAVVEPQRAVMTAAPPPELRGRRPFEPGVSTLEEGAILLVEAAWSESQP